MSLLNYWPSPENVLQCIRTEAEELAEHVLLAVHEPMQLVRVGNGVDQECTEEALLSHFMEVERPIPLIGRSGVGKSHLIRWLEAQLKLQPISDGWHIVRIPKNASLRQVLEKLLDGLEGEDFEQARARIRSVGDLLKTEEVADLLLTFMAQQLHRLNERSAEVIRYYRENPEARQQLSIEEGRRWKDIQVHTAPGRGLSELITDSNFKTSLLDPKHCIYQFASRLTQGATDQELSRNDYEIREEDLDFSFNLDDLSQNARQYIGQAQLNTNPQARASAVRVLNEVLGESTRTAFRYLFSFNGGGFQELFKDIRRTLKLQDRTLVVLVEDMAAISAIEDVLIDSLLEEAVRDGEQELCTLRSVLAVTDGYQGYLRRQDTIKTRAQYEWLIRDNGLQREKTLERIINFCGRYLNAARHGRSALESSWYKRSDAPLWPPVWQDEEGATEELQAFGNAPCGVPLFPFNRNAIAALADHYCKTDDELRFNPRQVLNQIVLRVLRHHRQSCEEHRFPPAEFAGLKTGAGLADLYRLDDPARCETLAAIWGYDSRSIDELQVNLDSQVAQFFGLKGLAELLREGKGASSTWPSAEKRIAQDNGTVHRERNPPSSIDVDQQRIEKIQEAVSLWFQRKQKLDQDLARDLRSGLERIYLRYSRYEWYGLRERPLLKRRLIPIELPYAIGNVAGWTLKFCTEKDFLQPERVAFLQGVALALLRHEYFNAKSSDIGWQYSSGFDDYLRCQNFAARWVPGVLQTLASEDRANLSVLMQDQIQLAKGLGLLGDCSNDRQRLNELLRPAQQIRESLPRSVVSALEQFRQQTLSEWDERRDAWLKLVSVNDHGIDGDLALKPLRDALKGLQEHKLARLDKEIMQAFQPSICALEVLEGCTRQEQFYALIDEMIELIRGVSDNGFHYPQPVDFPNSKKLCVILVGLKSNDVWGAIKGGHALRLEADSIKRLQLVNQLDGLRLREVVEALNCWSIFYQHVLPRLENENRLVGLDVLQLSQESVTELLDELTETLSDLREAGRDYA
jgi:hypothetical protein